MTIALAGLVVLGMWTGLARALLGSPIYAAVLDALLIALLVTAAWSLRHRRPGLRLTPLDVLVLAYVLMAMLEVFNPNVPGVLVGLEGFRKTAFMVAGYGVVRLAAGVDEARFLRIMSVGAVPALLWSMRQFLSPLPIEQAIISGAGTSPISFHAGTVLRAFAPTASPFHLGILAGAVVIVAVVLADRRSVRWMLVGVIAAIALGLSLTRANLIATAFALGVVAAVSIRLDRRLRMLGLAGGAVAVALAVAFAAAASKPPYRPPVSVAPPSPTVLVSPSPTTPEPSSTSRIQLPDAPVDKSLLFRFVFWQEQLSAAAERPLIGYGTSSAADGFDRLYAGTNSQNFEPHSIYMKVLLEQGVIGFAIFVVMLLVLAATATKRLRANASYVRTAAGIILLVAVSGVTGPMLDAYPFNLLFWCVAGLVASPHRPGAMDDRQ